MLKTIAILYVKSAELMVLLGRVAPRHFITDKRIGVTIENLAERFSSVATLQDGTSQR